jgi:acetyltransferase-like isoleucine patch superfamily enzyme
MQIMRLPTDALSNWEGRLRVARRADVTLHRTASIGRVHVSGWGPRGTISLGKGSRIESGVLLQISNGGSISLGDNVTIRRGAVLNVSGQLELRGSNLVSWYTIVHCTSRVTFEEMAGTGEAVTVVDSAHFHGEVGSPAEHWYHNSAADPVVIGSNTWLATKSTVSAGAVLGPRTTVAAHAFVRRGVYPAGALLRGLPVPLPA